MKDRYLGLSALFLAGALATGCDSGPQQPVQQAELGSLKVDPALFKRTDSLGILPLPCDNGLPLSDEARNEAVTHAQRVSSVLTRFLTPETDLISPQLKAVRRVAFSTDGAITLPSDEELCDALESVHTRLSVVGQVADMYTFNSVTVENDKVGDTIGGGHLSVEIFSNVDPDGMLNPETYTLTIAPKLGIREQDTISWISSSKLPEYSDAIFKKPVRLAQETTHLQELDPFKRDPRQLGSLTRDYDFGSRHRSTEFNQFGYIGAEEKPRN